MTCRQQTLTTCLSVFALFTFCLSGCSSPSEDIASTVTEDSHDGHDHGAEENQTGNDDHSGWWCAEHGVPEEECPRCDSSLIADFKAKGDWCDEHARPDSQCFQCQPELEAKFAARYEVKFGKQPPKPTDP